MLYCIAQLERTAAISRLLHVASHMLTFRITHAHERLKLERDQTRSDTRSRCDSTLTRETSAVPLGKERKEKKSLRREALQPCQGMIE